MTDETLGLLILAVVGAMSFGFLALIVWERAVGRRDPQPEAERASVRSQLRSGHGGLIAERSAPPDYRERDIE